MYRPIEMVVQTFGLYGMFVLILFGGGAAADLAGKLRQWVTSWLNRHP